MSHIPDHFLDLQGLIPEQYKHSTKLNGLVAAVMSGADDVETMLQELRDLWDMDAMEGVNLDIIGALSGMRRDEGESDESFRIRVKAGPVEKGLPSYEALRSLVKAATGSENVGLYPVWPADVMVVPETGAGVVAPMLDKWTAAGVKASIGTFLCSEDNPAVYIVSEDTGMPFVIDDPDLA